MHHTLTPATGAPWPNPAPAPSDHETASPLMGRAADAAVMSRGDARALRKAMAPYARPVLWKTLWQMANTFIPFGLCWALAYLSLGFSYALTLLFIVGCAGLVVRITIFQHDCGHYAFFKSRRANEWLARVIALFNFAPLCFWTRQHAHHHIKINNLDRGRRDIFAECLTAREYRRLKPLDRVIYRITREPFVFFLILAPLTMIIATRFPINTEKSWKAERRNIYLTNIAIFAVYGSLAWAVGFKEFALVQGPIIVIASGVGFWLDALGHRFPTAKWVHDEDWEMTNAALQGCGYFKLPKVLQWFSGNIGIHHVHHLNPRIPNYALQKCLDGTPALQAVESFTLWQAVRSAWLVLWDEDRGRLIRFSELAGAAPGAQASRT